MHHVRVEHKLRNADKTLAEVIDTAKEEIKGTIERCYKGQGTL